MASPSCEARAEKIVHVDRFSSLPEDISHEILSLISFKDLTRVGCVSKRCRRFSLSCPSLNFCQFSDVDLSTCEMRKRVLNSLERFLIQRGDNQIKSFRFRWFNHQVVDNHDDLDLSDCYCDYPRFSEWIDKAVRCNVEEVHLAITSQDLLHDDLPTSLFLCGSLRSLSVEMKCMIRDVHVPSMDIFSNLESINIRNVWIFEEGLWKWISNCCKFIKELHVENVVGLNNFTIESSSLESFSFVSVDPRNDSCSRLNISGDKIEKIHINCFGTNSFNFSAPNLKILEWTGHFVGDENLGELLCLERARISPSFKVLNFDALFNFLHTICRVKFLLLSEEIVKAFSREDFMPLQFYGVLYLRIELCSLNDDLVPAIVNLLRGMPNLRSLNMYSFTIHRTQSNCSGYDIDFWKLQDLAFISRIAEVVLGVDHRSNVGGFARYILEHAKNLEKMVIFHYPDQRDAVLNLESHMISNATISFHELEDISLLWNSINVMLC